MFTAVTKNAKNVRNHNLFVYDLPTGKINMLGDRQGINSGSVFSPVGKQIALTMSFPGNAEIFLMDPVSKVVQRITNSFGLDVDPTWSPDGKWLAFVSDRSGRPMVYKMEASGANVQRLTYAGYYNATPSWSPAGNKLAFAGWDAGKFDIFIMNTDGSGIERLTKSMGNNRDRILRRTATSSFTLRTARGRRTSTSQMCLQRLSRSPADHVGLRQLRISALVAPELV